MATEPDTTANTGGDGTVTADVVITDRELFDSAIGNEPAPAEPQAEPQPAAPEEAPQQDGQQQRDERGRFTAQQQAPQQRTPPQPQGRTQPQPQTPASAGAGSAPQQPEQPHQVPLRTYLDEREQRYRAQAQADQLRQQWERLQFEAQQQQRAQQQAQLPQTIYDNPEQYLIHNIILPMRQEAMVREMRNKDAMSREFANAQFGPQLVEHALRAMQQVRNSPQGNFVFDQIMSSGHPYGMLVNWYNRARAQQQIGNDPQAWMQKQRETLLNDPAFRAEALKREQAANPQVQQPQQRARSNVVNLPPSLSSMPASSGREEQGDMSDASLFRFATS